MTFQACNVHQGYGHASAQFIHAARLWQPKHRRDACQDLSRESRVLLAIGLENHRGLKQQAVAWPVSFILNLRGGVSMTRGRPRAASASWSVKLVCTRSQLAMGWSEVCGASMCHRIRTAYCQGSPHSERSRKRLRVGCWKGFCIKSCAR